MGHGAATRLATGLDGEHDPQVVADLAVVAHGNRPDDGRLVVGVAIIVTAVMVVAGVVHELPHAHQTGPVEPLPVESVVPDLWAALGPDGPGSAVLTAEPGAGKTTVVPLRLAPLFDGRIVMLEPRRVATRAAARRMASTLGEDVGDTVGYVTRDDRRTSTHTRIEVVTEGVLTRRLQRDPELPGASLVIFDEFHERNLQGDLGLAFALESRATLRPDLRVMVMSATLDVGRVASLLGDDTAVVHAPGRSHPVDVRWVPRQKRDRLDEVTAAAVQRALREQGGDVLVFLPGMADIRRVHERLAGVDADVRLLHGSLPVEEQDLALAPGHGRRKIVLSTDIAESSLTVEGVSVVVDSGLARAPRFDAATGMTRLHTVPISKASADQRAGRAGRTSPGVAYRLWSKLEHAARRPHIDPEILQVDLAGLALELAAWGTDRLTYLLDQPPKRTLDEARDLLGRLGAVAADGSITATGRAMADLPLHPRLAHMVVVEPTWTACVIAALLEERDILRGPPDEQPADIAVRLELVASGRAPGHVIRRAGDLARRAGVARDDTIDSDRAGAVLAAAYPDRVAQRRSPGRFRLRSGSGAWLPATDALADADYLVAAELDGRRTDARIRLAAALDQDDLLHGFADDVEEHARIAWDTERGDVVATVERRLGGLVLGTVERRPPAGPQVERILRDRLRTTHLADLAWTDEARRLRSRLAFLRRTFGPPWPPADDDKALLAALDLSRATSVDDLRRIDVVDTLRSLLEWDQHAALERLAPPSIRVPSGRTVAVDYDADPPVLAVRVQDAFGLVETPTVADGAVTLVVHLLSPAGRPVQVTSDLGGFWKGSWHAVRKDMAGRYPKHPWPEIPPGH